MSTFELFSHFNSPFVRKVLIASRELGLRDRLQLKQVAPLATENIVDLNPYNPLAQIPTLVTSTGSIFDSSVIVQYLDSLSSKADVKVLPPLNDLARYEALTYEALCDGVLGACLLVRYEGVVRTAEQRHEGWVDGQTAKIKRGIAQLGTKLPLPENTAPVWSLQGIALACLLWYLDRRFPKIGWRQWEGGERLEKWYDEAVKRESWTAEAVPPL